MGASITPEAIRLNPRTAALALDIDVLNVRKLVAEGVFTPLRPDGKGPGKRLWLYADEVRVYATEGRDGVLSYRRLNGRLPGTPKRNGRKS
jgi:hypothetical protein